MLQFFYDFIDKYIDRSDYEMAQMDTDSNYFAFSEDSIEKIIKPNMREGYEKDKYNFLPSESEELHPTFQVDGVRFTWAQFDMRTPGRFKVECRKDKLISLCSKMYYAGNHDDNEYIISCKGIQKDKNSLNCKDFENVLNGGDNNVENTGFRYHAGVMKTYEQSKIGLSGNNYKRILKADGRTTRLLTI